MQVPAKSKAKVHAEIYAALAQDTDEAFGALLDTIASHSTPDGDFPLVNEQHPETGATALMVAVARGRADAVAAFLRLGADTEVWSFRLNPIPRSPGCQSRNRAFACKEASIPDMVGLHE